MSRKHHVKKNNASGGYQRRQARKRARGFSANATMRWTGMSTEQITREFAGLPHYRWMLVTHTQDGKPIEHPYQRRVEIR